MKTAVKTVTNKVTKNETNVKKAPLKVGIETKKAIEKETITKQAIEATKVNIEAIITQKPKELKTEKVTYLMEGISGKQFQEFRKKLNNVAKSTNFSFSYMKKLVLKTDLETNFEWSKSIKNFNVDDLTPTNLIPLLTKHELTFKIKHGKIKSEEQKFSVWLITNLITRYYKNLNK
jgi:hypothetical protein